MSLIFTFKTHKHLYIGEHKNFKIDFQWSTRKAIAVLIVSMGFIAILSEFHVDAVKPVTASLGLSKTFVGIILIAIIGNAAEHIAAIPLAIKNNLDASLGITLGGSQQTALFVAPILIFVSHLIGDPMDLHFTSFEVVAVMISVLGIKFVTTDGESNWMEGILLLSIYLIFAIAFYLLPT